MFISIRKKSNQWLCYNLKYFKQMRENYLKHVNIVSLVNQHPSDFSRDNNSNTDWIFY